MSDIPHQPKDDSEGMMLLADSLSKIIEVAAGHRERAIAAGFSPTMAEQMAFTVHQGMCMKAFNP